MSSCRGRLVTIDETWLYHNDPETKQQSMEWRHSGSPHHKKIPSPKISWKISHFGSLGSRRHPTIDYLQKGQPINAEYYLSLLVQLKDSLKEKRRWAGRSPRGSCSCTTENRLTGHLQPRRNWPSWDSCFLITNPILRILSRRTTTSSLDLKK